MELGRKTYTGIDCFKLIAALLVVGIHTSFLWDVNPTLSLVMTQVVARVAVPFFFICTGFFYSKKIRKQPDTAFEYLKQYNRKLLTLYAAWVLLMLPFWTKNAIHAYGVNGHLVWMLLRTILFDPGVFWYILALCVCSLVAYRSILGGRFRGLLVVASLLYLFGLFGDSYYGLVKNAPVVGDIYRWYFSIFIHVRKGLPFGLLFFTIGSIFALREEKLHPNPWIMFALLVASLGLRYVEFSILHFHDLALDNSVSLFGIPPAIFAFLLALDIHPRVGDGASLKLRALSSAIYFSHQWILEILILTVFSWYPGIICSGRWCFAVALCTLLFIGIRKSGSRVLMMLINS